MRNRLLSPMVVLLLAGASVVPSADVRSQFKGLVMPARYYVTLATCETGMNWQHNTRTYTSGFGISRRTFSRWSSRSPQRGARGMTPREQAIVADAIAWHGYTHRDGEFIYPVGPWGWGCVKIRPALQQMICASQHPKVQRWKRGC